MNIDRDEIIKYINEVQVKEIRKLLGDKMYFSLLENLSESKYIDIINEKNYTYSGYNYTHYGLKSVIAFFVKEKVVKNSHYKDTYSGHVIKESDFSRQISNGERKNLAKEYRETAFSYYELVDDFICRNINVYDYCYSRRSNKMWKA
jgi:hypothetical protein